MTTCFSAAFARATRLLLTKLRWLGIFFVILPTVSPLADHHQPLVPDHSNRREWPNFSRVDV